MNISDSIFRTHHQTRKVPIADLMHGMDSAVTAQALDQVDLGKFQPDKIFTQGNAATMIALATASYSTPEDQQAHLSKQSAVKSFHILSSANNASLGIPSEDKGGNVTVVETDQALLVAARGTSAPWLANHGLENGFNLADLTADFNALPVSNHSGTAKVHAGFKNQADSIWLQLKPLLQTAIATHKAIHMAGHSLGAAVALHLFERTKQELGVSPQSLIRFAGPDVGWDDEKAHLDANGTSARTVNVLNSGDPVPLALPLGESAGAELYFNRHGQADIGGGKHLFDQAAIIADDGRTGHALIPMNRHFPQYYIQGITDPANAAVLRQLEERMNRNS